MLLAVAKEGLVVGGGPVVVEVVVRLLMAASSEPWGLSLLPSHEGQGLPLGREEGGGVAGMSRKREDVERVRRWLLLMVMLLQRAGTKG